MKAVARRLSLDAKLLSHSAALLTLLFILLHSIHLPPHSPQIVAKFFAKGATAKSASCTTPRCCRIVRASNPFLVNSSHVQPPQRRNSSACYKKCYFLHQQSLRFRKNSRCSNRRVRALAAALVIVPLCPCDCTALHTPDVARSYAEPLADCNDPVTKFWSCGKKGAFSRFGADSSSLPRLPLTSFVIQEQSQSRT